MKQLEEQKDFPDYNFPLFLTYIPFVNLVTLPKVHSKYNTHIINGLYITAIATAIIVASLFGIVPM